MTHPELAPRLRRNVAHQLWEARRAWAAGDKTTARTRWLAAVAIRGVLPGSGR